MQCYGTLKRRMLRLRHCRAVLFVFVGSLTILPAGVATGDAAGRGPQTVVREFCQADGLGQRVSIQGWAEIAPLVAWAYEPAWDHVLLITGYQVGSPRTTPDSMVVVDVDYTVVGKMRALDGDTDVRVERVSFPLQTAEGMSWRIAGPPPPPHLFVNRVDVDQVRQSLQTGAVNFLPNSLFLWQMFQGADWPIEFQPVETLLSGPGFRAVTEPKTGDVIVYLRDGVPYHAGILAADQQVVSSTLNAGIVRTRRDAFPGEVKYVRLVEPAPIPAIARPTPEEAPGRDAAAAGSSHPTVTKGQRQPTPGATHRKQKSRKAKRSPSKRVETSREHSPTPAVQPTQAAH